MVKPFLCRLKSIHWQLLSSFIVSLYVALLLIIQYNKNIYREPIASLPEPSIEAKRNASLVEVGMHIHSFPFFSFKDTEFTMDATVWFKFDQGCVSLDIIEKFTIKNTLRTSDRSLQYKSPPKIKLIDNKVLVAYHIQITMLAEVDFHKFPLSDHRLNFYIEHKDVADTEILFVSTPDHFTIADEILVDDWKPRNFHVCPGVVHARLGSPAIGEELIYPSVAVSLDFENIGARGLTSLYLPLLILFFLGLFSLCIDLFDSTRLGIIGSALPTLVLFRLVIDGASPSIGYPTHIDFVYYVLVALTFIVLFFQIYLGLISDSVKKQPEEKQSKTRGRLLLLNAFLFFAILAVLVIILTIDFFR